MTETAQIPPTHERPAINVPGFVVTWPKVVALSGTILVSVLGGFFGLSSTIYEGLKSKVERNETKNDSLDNLTSVIQAGVSKQDAQIAALDRNVSQLTDQIKLMTATLSDTRDKVISVDAKLSTMAPRGVPLGYSPRHDDLKLKGAERPSVPTGAR